VKNDTETTNRIKMMPVAISVLPNGNPIT
jgi:hypothetical protein